MATSYFIISSPPSSGAVSPLRLSIPPPSCLLCPRPRLLLSRRILRPRLSATCLRRRLLLRPRLFSARVLLRAVVYALSYLPHCRRRLSPTIISPPRYRPSPRLLK
jgi:hypothetical protein